MRRKQQVFVQQSSPPKSIGARIFSSIGSLLLSAFLLFLSFLGVLALGWVLQKLFPQHEHSAKSGSSQSASGSSRSAVPDEVQSYLNAVGKQVKASGTDLGALVQLSADASAKPTLLRTQDWHVKVAGACGTLESEGKALQNIDPVPSSCVEMNADVHRAGRRYEEIAEEFSSGADIRHLDTNTILRAVRLTDIVTQQDDKALVADSNRIRAKFRN